MTRNKPAKTDSPTSPKTSSSPQRKHDRQVAAAAQQPLPAPPGMPSARHAMRPHCKLQPLSGRSIGGGVGGPGSTGHWLNSGGHRRAPPHQSPPHPPLDDIGTTTIMELSGGRIAVSFEAYRLFTLTPGVVLPPTDRSVNHGS